MLIYGDESLQADHPSLIYAGGVTCPGLCSSGAAGKEARKSEVCLHVEEAGTCWGRGGGW